MYPIFAEEDNIPLERIYLDDELWYMYFDDSFSSEGNGVGITLVLCAHPEIRTTLNIQAIDMPVRNYSIISGRDWQALTGGYLSLDRTHLSVPQNYKNIIVLREGRISPYIESVLQSRVNYIEEDLGVYSIFVEEDNIPLEQINLDDDIWHMHFDGSCYNEGNGAGIIFVSLA